ncbi:MAG: hypothetical protein H6Q79_1962, partial [Deltaproteobacteria bacterium]|nr:hypothetical protein [Deltaproteobacteria bacterium]
MTGKARMVTADRKYYDALAGTPAGSRPSPTGASSSSTGTAASPIPPALEPILLCKPGMLRKFGEAYREYLHRVPRSCRSRGLHQQGEDGPLGEREDGAGREPEDQDRRRGDAQ